MTAIYIDQKLDDDTRRSKLYGGDIFVYSANEHSMALVEVARKLIAEAFPGIDPRTAQYKYDVREFAGILSKLKPAFIHHPDCKKIIPRMLDAIGCDLDQVHFDIPRMRSSTSNNYLTTGIAYAFHPNYFSRGVLNDSDTYNYQEWNARMRFNAAEFVGEDTRPQPHAQEQLLLEPKTVVVTPPGGMLLFSAAQMHSSIPNQTGQTRFSIDFRCVHLGDLKARRGARNVDSKCTGSAINDYLQGSTLNHIPQDVQDIYMPGHPQPVERVEEATA